jgi:predicted GNAT family N-acyltransferase
MPQPTATAIHILAPSIHDRAGFDCGVEALNRYLREQASQDMKRLAAGCWVLVDPDKPSEILGFYTLSTDSVLAHELETVSPTVRKKLPRYPKLGAILLGRLAVATPSRNRGLGKKLLFDAISRCAAAEVPAPLMLVDAKDEEAEAFYARYGFERLVSARYFLPMHALQAGLGSSD